jgi:Arm DNA-binding domain
MPAAARKIALTDRSLKALKPALPGRRLTLWDAVQPNFAVRVSDKRTRSFYAVKRRAGSPNPVWLKLGVYPEVSLAKARARARAALEAFTGGPDPRPGIVASEDPLPVATILALPRPSQVGIYFLLLGTTLQYIGQTNDVFKRIRAHEREGKIPFDDWRLLPAGLGDLGVLEEIHIRVHRPPFNRGIKGRGR